MRVSLCAIAKCENLYIKEWVDYHLKLDFDHIYIYDNNEVDGERISDVIKDERVTIIKLTDKGADLKEQCKDIPSKVAPTLGALDGDEIAQLYALLYKVINS